MKRFAAFCVALFATASARADDPKDAKPLKAPFETLKTQHMAVQVKINGKGPYRLIFDTGAPVTLLNNKTARETGPERQCTSDRAGPARPTGAATGRPAGRSTLAR